METIHIKAKAFLLLFLFFSIGLFGQDNAEKLAKSYIEQTFQRYNLYEDDIREWSITSSHISKKSGIHHIYGIQKHNGIEIYNATFDLHTFDGNKVVTYHNYFISNLASKTKNTKISPKISQINAIESAARQLNLNLKSPIKPVKNDDSMIGKLFDASDISLSLVPVKKMYYLNTKNELTLVWDLSIEELSGENWWSLKIDASTGLILDKVNWVQSCLFGSHEHTENKPNVIADKNIKMNNLAGGYNVYPFPIESPNHGSRSWVTNPDNVIASPFGWHDTNGITGAEFTITKGNNVHAYEDGDNAGFSPNGGSSLMFNFPINTTYTSGNQSEAAVITNLFYWNNICHDIWYQYGFDEVSGNFQENNYGNGASGSDSVNAEAQKGLLCNAFFSTPPDGQNPTMNMYVGNCGPLTKDGSIDNLVIVHEFGHGISKRLVGGRTNTNVLFNQEQMGEGWSDWFGLMMTIESNAQETDLRPVGTWLFGQSANGPGIRNWPYSTDMTASQYTYDDIKTLSVPHGVGSVWASMLWELTWELISVYGYDTDLYSGNGGNNIAMQLVIEGLKLTPNSPGFVDARDAILQADQVIYNGANQCYIWKAFAKRGLGVSATQGSANSHLDGTEAFDEPDCVDCEENRIETGIISSNQVVEVSNTITSYSSIEPNANVTYSAGNQIILRPSSRGFGFHAKQGSTFRAYIEGCESNKSPKNSFKNQVPLKTENQLIENDLKTEIIKLYPNPANNEINLESLNVAMSRYIIYDMSGKNVGSKDALQNNKTTIPIDRLSNGIYFIKVELQDGNAEVLRFIKE